MKTYPPTKHKYSHAIMDQYGIYYMTFTLVGWVDVFSRKQCAQILIDSLQYCQANKGLKLYAYVIMTNHLHLIASAKTGSAGLSAIGRDFKRHTSTKIIQWITDNRKESRRAWLDIVFKYYGKYNSSNHTHQVWQQHNKPKLCFSQKFTLQKLNYIHNNPVKAGMVDHPEDYRYSSARNYLGRTDALFEIQLLDYGSMIGHIK